jgi:hypothetical protein
VESQPWQTRPPPTTPSSFDQLRRRRKECVTLCPWLVSGQLARRSAQWYVFSESGAKRSPPRLHRFQVGDYVYVAQKPINSLDVTTTLTILRVRAVKPNGVLELEGADGTVVRTRMELCAPCHIPHLVTDAVGVPADLACAICGSPCMADPMLLCDRCDNGYHMQCLAPPLEQVLVGQWCCPQCQKS